MLWINAIKHWQKEKKFQNLDCTKRKRKRKSTRTTPTKKSLLTNLLKSLALVQLLVSTLRTFPICLPIRLCPHCPCPFTNSSSHMLDLLQRLLLKHLSLLTSLAMIWNHPCGLHSSALSALFVCTLLPTKRTSSATSCCTGRWGGSFPAFCAPNSSTGLTMSSGTFAVYISSTWTQRVASSLRPAWHCDTRFELRAQWHLCRPVDVPLIMCAYVYTFTCCRWWSYASWLPHMCVLLVKGFVLLIDLSVTTSRWRQSVLKWLWWYPCLR